MEVGIYLLAALAMTLLIEVPLGSCILRSFKCIVPIILVNILTNPIINVVLWLVSAFGAPVAVYFSVLVFGELAVIFVEAWLIARLCSKGMKRVFALSAASNLVSAILGSEVLALLFRV